MPTWQFYVNGVRPNGEGFALHQHAFGGMGGRPGDDGLASVSFPYNVSDVSIEWSEMETPVLYEARELIPDSGGAGEFRGGLGQELVFSAYRGRVKEGEPLVLSGSAARIRFPPRGARRRGGRIVRGDRGERGGDCAFELAERDGWRQTMFRDAPGMALLSDDPPNLFGEHVVQDHLAQPGLRIGCLQKIRQWHWPRGCCPRTGSAG